MSNGTHIDYSQRIPNNVDPRDESRTINFGDDKGRPAWQDVPGEYQSPLRRMIVTQGDTEPASVEQQRPTSPRCPCSSSTISG